MSTINSITKHFPVPKFLSLAHAGVDISPSGIRFISFKKTKNGLVPAQHGEQLFTTPILDASNMQKHPDVQVALKKMQREHKLNFVEASIPEEKAYLYTTDVPAGTDEEIRNNIEFHLEENVPLSLGDAVYDYFVINKNEKNNTVFIAVSVVPRGIVEEYIALFLECGMTPVSFLIENQAVSKAIIKKGDMSSYLIVNLGLHKTVLSVVSEDAVQFTSTIQIGTQDFTKAIMKEFCVAEQEAEKIKQEKGFSRTKENETLFLSLINTASALKDEISRISVYWESYRDKMKAIRKIEPITSVLLVGKDSSLVGFREYLAVSLKMNVELANVWSNVLSFDKDIPEIPYLDSLNYATVIGLALPKSMK